MNTYHKLFSIIRQTDLLNYDERNELELYLMNLKEQVKKQKEVIDKAVKIFNECKLLMPHEFDWGEQVDNVLDKMQKLEGSDSNENI